jgi:4-hydroxy-tetrahydrodipicolinate reductase
MKIALIGYGKMGHAIESMAVLQGHTIVCTIDNDADWDRSSDAVRQADVAIEFTTPTTAVGNIRRCFDIGIPVVCGTTGWTAQLPELTEECIHRNQALFVASNFSIGMNIMFMLNEYLAHIMAAHPDYSVGITETHHIHKLDAPSGTAITLRDQIAQEISGEINITSIREGEVPGIHTVTYDSPNDTITLTHSAHNRNGLAQGALAAAEYLVGRKGFFTMRDLLQQ